MSIFIDLISQPLIWLYENKEWLLSGAGVAILGVFISWFMGRTPGSSANTAETRQWIWKPVRKLSIFVLAFVFVFTSLTLFVNWLNGNTAPEKGKARAARHQAALDFPHNLDEAISASQHATDLDPENMDGWDQLGHLLYTRGALSQDDTIGAALYLDRAEEAYRKVESLAKAKQDWKRLATTYRHLGNIYRIRGDIDQTKMMYCTANVYDNLDIQ